MSTMRDLEAPFTISTRNTKSSPNICEVIVNLCGIGVMCYYIYYGIKMLWENQSLAHHNKCTISHLWQAVLVSVILASLGLLGKLYTKNSKKADNSDNIFCELCLFIIIYLLLIAWNSVEVFVIPYTEAFNITENYNLTYNKTACRELVDTAIWKFEWVTVILQIVVVSLLIIGLLGLSCCNRLNL